MHLYSKIWLCKFCCLSDNFDAAFLLTVAPPGISWVNHCFRAWCFCFYFSKYTCMLLMHTNKLTSFLNINFPSISNWTDSSLGKDSVWSSNGHLAGVFLLIWSLNLQWVNCSKLWHCFSDKVKLKWAPPPLQDTAPTLWRLNMWLSELVESKNKTWPGVLVKKSARENQPGEISIMFYVINLNL